MENKPSNFAIAVLSTRDELYQGFKTLIHQTWAEDFRRNGVSVIFYEGDPSIDQLTFDEETQTLSCPIKDGFDHTYGRSLMMFKWLFGRKDIDFVFRPNLSALIDAENFYGHLEQEGYGPQVFTGPPGQVAHWYQILVHKGYKPIAKLIKNLGPKINFVSGAGFFLGRDVFEFVKDFRPEHPVGDDVGLGLGAKKFLTPFPRQLNFVKTKDDLSKAIEAWEHGEYQFRFKTNDRDADLQRMMEFYQIISGAKKLS